MTSRQEPQDESLLGLFAGGVKRMAGYAVSNPDVAAKVLQAGAELMQNPPSQPGEGQIVPSEEQARQVQQATPFQPMLQSREEVLVRRTPPVATAEPFAHPFYHEEHADEIVNKTYTRESKSLLHDLDLDEIVRAFLMRLDVIFPHAFFVYTVKESSEYNGRAKDHKKCAVATRVLVEHIVYDPFPARTYEELKFKLIEWALLAEAVYKTQVGSSRGPGKDEEEEEAAPKPTKKSGGNRQAKRQCASKKDG